MAVSEPHLVSMGEAQGNPSFWGFANSLGEVGLTLESHPRRFAERAWEWHGTEATHLESSCGARASSVFIGKPATSRMDRSLES